MLRAIFRLLSIVAIAIAVTICIPPTSYGAPQCDTRERVIAVLAEKYKESPVAIGVTHNGGLIEVLTTGNGSTWSIIVTTPQGWSCLVAAGEGWRSSTPVSLDPEA